MAGTNHTLKVLVNWGEKKVATTRQHRGSTEFKHLRDAGYVEVATIKDASEVYVRDEFFDPKGKYFPHNEMTIKT